jgi:hypothetical protein
MSRAAQMRLKGSLAARHPKAGSVTRIRTVTVTLPRMLGDLLVGAIAPEAELEVVGRFASRANLDRRLGALAPALVLIGLRRGEPDDVARGLLLSVPAARILAVTPDGRHAYLHRMRACRKALLEITPEGLRRALLEIEPASEE